MKSLIVVSTPEKRKKIFKDLKSFSGFLKIQDLKISFLKDQLVVSFFLKRNNELCSKTITSLLFKKKTRLFLVLFENQMFFICFMLVAQLDRVPNYGFGG